MGRREAKKKKKNSMSMFVWSPYLSPIRAEAGRVRNKISATSAVGILI